MHHLSYALLVFLGLLIFIWQIPNTISIRYLAFGGLVIISLLMLYRMKQDGKPFGDVTSDPHLRWLGMILLVLTVWFYFVAFFLSPEPDWSIKEINGQWLMALGYGILGIFLSLATNKNEFLTPQKVVNVIFFVTMIHVLYVDLYAIKYYVTHGGVLPTRFEGLGQGPTNSNHMSIFALCILLTEMIYRFLYKGKILILDRFLLSFSVMLVLVSLVVEAMRFGYILTFVLVVTCLILLYRRVMLQRIVNPWKLHLLTGSVMVVMLGIGMIAFNQSRHWSTMIETIPLALDTENQKAWMDWERYGPPTLSDGTEVSHSNYVRLAWFKKGLEIMVEYPMGVGYGRGAFPVGLAQLHPDLEWGKGGMSESGIIDLGVGAGFLGVILWMVFVFGLMMAGYTRFSRCRSFFGLLLFFTVLAFAIRMVMDSIIRDHMLEQFIFYSALFYGWMRFGERQKLTGGVQQ